MARFTRSQLTQLLVFCLYWFVIFPLIWFVVKPEFFASSILLTVLFALLLLVLYFLIYRIIRCCCQEGRNDNTAAALINTNRNRNAERYPKKQRPGSTLEGIENRVYSPTTTTNNNPDDYEAALGPPLKSKEIPEAVPLNQQNVGKPNDKAVQHGSSNQRFVTEFSLFYDGKGRFHDSKL
uniref:Uncharacterized protein n=1 Tax=Stomoxys calcitrans TaxID=35570 RepID=A0A1I8P5N3_STOCA